MERPPLDAGDEPGGAAGGAPGAYGAQAAGGSDVRVALLALREERATLELAAKMAGELEGPAQQPRTTLLWSFDPAAVFPAPDPPGVLGAVNGNGVDS